MTGANDLTAEQIRALLQLEPNHTCGFTRATFASPRTLAAGALPPPFAAERPVGTALYFMVTPAAPVRLHRIKNDQLYHYYLGEPLELVVMRPDGSSDKVVIGPDLAAGQHVQYLIPGDTFHTARLAGRRWFLGGSTGWPGVIAADVEIGDAKALAKRYPAVAQEILSFGET